MRLAFIGKGGSGKSTVAGTVARILAREGQPVLALDVDPLPGLAFSIGLRDVPDAGLPAELGVRQEGKGWVMKEEIAAEDLVDRYAVRGPDGIRFLQLGKMPGEVRPGSTVAFRHVLQSFQRPGWSIIGDLSAGTRQAFAGWAGFATRIAIVASPSPAGLLTAKRLRRMAEMMPGAALGLIFNKVDADAMDRKKKADEVALPLWPTLPYDEEVARADRAGEAVIDAAPGSKAVSAIEGFVQTITGGSR